MKLLDEALVRGACAILALPAAAQDGDKLVDAAKRGNIEAVRALLSQGADVNGTDKKGNTALMEASRTGKADVVQALIQAGAGVNSQNRDGWTAAMRAIMARQTETLKLLVAAGADVRLKNEKGEDAFQIAVGYGTANIRPEILSILAKAGVDPNAATVRGKPALIHAISSLESKMVGGLVKAGADPDVKDEKGRPALVLAADNGNLDQGVEMVAALVAGGADVNARDSKGRSALEHAVDISKMDYQKEAARKNSGKIVYILASRGADTASVSAARKSVLEDGFLLFDTLIVKGIQASREQQRAAAAPARGAAAAPRTPSKKPAGTCPGSSTVKSISSENPAFRSSLPIDLSRIRSARALAKRNGTRIKVFLANAPFTAQQMDSSMVIPVKKKGEAVVVLNFMNDSDKVVRGDYRPSAGYGKPMSVSADVMVTGGSPSGTVITFVAATSSDTGKATITEAGDRWVCGSFEIAGGLGSLSGEFAAELDSD